MPNDITSTLRFIADASQAIGTMRALAAEAQALNRAVTANQQSIARQQQGSGVGYLQSTKNFVPGLDKAGTYVLPAKTVIDQFNKTLRTTYDTVVLNAQGQELLRSTTSKATGSLEAIESAATRYGRANLVAADGIKQATQNIRDQATTISNTQAPFRARAKTLRDDTVTLREYVRVAREARAALNPPPGVTYRGIVGQRRNQQIAAADAQVLQAEKDLRSKIGQLGYATRAIERDPIVQTAKARLQALKQVEGSTVRAANALERATERALGLASSGAPPLPATLETVRRESPNLFNRLAGKGLGKDASGAFSTGQLYAQGADQLTLTRDLERNVSTLRGQYRGLNGELINVNASYAEGGRVIGRYGGVLSGTQNFLRQTVNNLQKVVQWGLATTAVFAGIGLATSALDTVRNLDKSLNQLSITAQLSSRQTADVFDDLSNIAYATATPLEDMVKAADDIALATKRANQSTEEWQGSIKSLATSVGILTNITGLDTVKATDLLTSTMKQLNLESTDLTSILNKVAAVAGGQANSITDIVSGLGAMAEAAQTASLSIDETIGVVQVLGQVTSKSSSEIATSFKNLVGSVDSVGGTKALEKYEISTRDTEGNLKNILQIYEEIQAKIRSGVIPEADIKDLIRGIAGGPRRAPDASALLANVDAIREAQARAAGATNEALVANAKYLDTIDAKITQLQVKFQTFVAKAFGPAIKGFITDVSNALSILLDFLAKVDPGLVQTVLGVTAFITALKLLAVVGNFLVGGLRAVWTGFTLVNQAALLASETVLGAGAATVTSTGKAVSAIGIEIAEIDQLILRHEAQAAAALAAGNAEVAAAERAAAANAATLKQFAGGQYTQTAGGILVPGGRGGGTPSPTSRLGRLAGLGPAAGYAAAGAGLTAATGGSLGQVIGGGAQAAGLGLLLNPATFALGPLVVPAKALGAALLVVGTGLQLITGENKKAASETKSTSTEILAAIGRYTEAREAIAGLTSTQDKLKESLTQLAKEQATSYETTGLISDTINQYTQNTLDLAEANKALTESIKELSDSQYKEQITLAQSGSLSTSALKKLQQQLYKEIFSKTNPELFVRDGANAISPSIVSGGILANGSSIAQTGQRGLVGGKLGSGAPTISEVDLANLKEAQDVLLLFNQTGTELRATFAPTAENIDAIRAALEEAALAEGELGERAKQALITFENTQATISAIAQANIIGKQQESLLNVRAILGDISAEQQGIGLANIKSYQELIGQTANVSKNVGPDERGQASEDIQKQAQELFFYQDGSLKLTKLTVAQAKEYLTTLGVITEYTKLGLELSDSDVALIAQKYGLAVQLTAEQQKQVALSEEMQAIQDKLNAQSISALDDLASKSGDIQRQYLSGDITKKQRDSMLEGAKATEVLQQKMITLFETFANNKDVLATFEDSLSRIPGLENLTGKEADEASALLGSFFNSMDLTQKGASGLITRILQLIAALNAIPKTIVSSVVIAVNTVSGLSANAAKVYSDFRAKETGGNTTAQAAKNSINNQIQNLMKQIQNIGSSNGTSFLGTGGGGSSGSKSTPTGPGLDVSQIDLPEELYGANQSSLIKEAIKRARALQKTIPGASKEASNDVVSILKGTQNLLTVRGVKDDLLRRALEELADIEKKRLEFETKADTIRRIRVGGGDFSAIANVPVNSRTGVSLGNSQGPINVTLNLNGTVLSPAQLAQFADLVAASLKRQIAG